LSGSNRLFGGAAREATSRRRDDPNALRNSRPPIGLEPGTRMARWLQWVRARTGPVAGCLLLLLPLTVGTAAAQDAGKSADNDVVARFYRGKTLNIFVGSPAGGGYDGYARLLARHFSKYIPGQPSVVVQDMPGAGSNKAAGFIYTQAPKDGTAIGAVQPGALLAQLLTDQAVQQDARKFIYLGNANSDVYLCLVRADAPVKSFAEMFTHEVLLGASAEGTTLRDMPVMLDNVLHTRFRMVTGYAGSHEVTLAIEKGEVQGMCGMGYVSISMEHPDWIASGAMRVLAQEDLKGHPDLNRMGVPRTIEFARTDEDRQVMELFYSQNIFGRPYVLPPGVPAERVAALRKAFMAAFADSDLIEDARKIHFEVGALSGEDVQALVARIFALPPRISERAKQALVYHPPAP
jgi:tripartite-type tricarboxylate transporter receptor subunit TctC